MPSRRACRHGAHAVTARTRRCLAVCAGGFQSFQTSGPREGGAAFSSAQTRRPREGGAAFSAQALRAPPRSGTALGRGHLAYTFQEAWWMLNTSVVENVCLGQELDPAWQGRILEACALWADVDTIPAGVHTSFAEQKQNLGPAQGPSRLLCRQEARLRPERSVKSILEKDHTTSLTQMEVPLDDHDRTAWPTGKDSMQYGRISNFRKKPQERRFQDGQAPRERDRCRNRVVSTIPNEVQGSFCGSGWTVGINQIRQVEARQGTAPHRRRCMQPTGGQEDLPLWDFGSDTVLHPSPLQPTEQEIFAGLKSLSKLPEQGRAATLPAQELSAEGRGTKNRETAHAAGWVHPPPQQSPAD
ncbi:uncharacterized protein LOC104653327 isoform X7 [Saimiri boliviensis]|uniref:uncharacterized protein LOC104653327 isoform X7 n=1 Tax=Saimiri boliviensis TaxID=27679 RepID=UPI003D77DB63